MTIHIQAGNNYSYMLQSIKQYSHSRNIHMNLKCLKIQSGRLERILAFALNGIANLKPDGQLENLMGMNFSQILVYAEHKKTNIIIKCSSNSSVSGRSR